MHGLNAVHGGVSRKAFLRAAAAPCNVEELGLVLPSGNGCKKAGASMVFVPVAKRGLGVRARVFLVTSLDDPVWKFE